MAANGERLTDEQTVFRAFADKSYRDRKRQKVRAGAYLLRQIDAADGLSVGTTPEAAVMYLERNYGYCSINVGEIHGLPYGLEVRLDPENSNHAFILNLPLTAISDEQRELAQMVAGELARRSTPVAFDTFVPSAEK